MRIVQIALNLLVAVPAIGMGAITLVSPNVPPEAVTENAIVGVVLIATAAVLVFDMFRPLYGGVLLLAWAIVFGVTFNGFHLSELLLISRPIGYQPLWSAITTLVAVLGVFSILRAKFPGTGKNQPS